MFGDLLSAIMNSTYSLGGQMSADANLAIGLAQAQTTITGGETKPDGTKTFGWTGDPNLKVSGQGDHSDWINWGGSYNIPAFKGGVFYATYQILAVINYIANMEQGEKDDSKRQAEEAERSGWSNLLNASSNSKELQTQPFQTLSSGESSEINNAQSALQGQGTFTSLISDLSGATAQLITSL
jgi:hypothetical protein